MRPWARWAAKTTLVAGVGFVTATGGLSGIAFAAAGGGNPGGSTLLGGNGLLAPVSSVPADVCGDASALLGIAVAGCRGGAAAAALGKPKATSAGAGLSGSGSTRSGSPAHVPASRPAGVCGNAATVLGASAAGCAGGPDTGGPGSSSASTGLQPGATPGPASSVLRRTFGDTLNAPDRGAGSTDTPPASQLARLGTLPGLAGLTSVAGVTYPPAGDARGSSLPMPGGTLSAADASGLGSESFAVLAFGALLAGAAALKIASRRARDRKAGIGATI